MKVSNRKCIRQLSCKSIKASRARNIIAIVAIALTTVLFTSLFTVALSINHSFQQANFRQVGGWAHGSFKYLTKQQFDELKTDPLIKEYGIRRIAGMADGPPFTKYHVEVGYADENTAYWMFCDPIEGRLPKEGTNEAATDTKVLELLKVEPVLGNEFTIALNVDGASVTEKFVLSGYWTYDEAVVANHVLLPHSRVQSIYDKTHIGNGVSENRLIGAWNMEVMLQSSRCIEKDMQTILANHGYQNTAHSQGDHYVAIGVNWGYTGAQLANSIDIVTVIGIIGILLIIVFTGYLIIYNVFQISVSNDIRFYGLLKTIGTTGRQIKRIIRHQALLLSLIGIPVGLMIGYSIGIKLTPVVLAHLNGVVQDAVSAHPFIFLGSALFALLTVILSCRRPGRMAAKVSPVEALRYTEVMSGKKVTRKAFNPSLAQMAWVNLGRNRGKTVITITSLSLAVLLLNMTVTFTSGFDMDKYLKKVVADFIVADAGYFQVETFWGQDYVLPEEAISAIEAQEGIESSGRVYGLTTPAAHFVTEDYYRKIYGRSNSSEALDYQVKAAEKNERGLLADRVQLYGMEDYALERIKVFDGDISKLSEPGGRYVAAVYGEDDYGNIAMGSHSAKLGDIITVRYIAEYEYFDPDTGEILDMEAISDNQAFSHRAKIYRDIEYEVAALITMTHSLSYRYYGADEYVMNAQTFTKDSQSSDIMYYAFDVKEEYAEAMESFMSGFTNEQMTMLDYESRETYQAEFNSFRNMFLILGCVLSLIVALVGVLNFLNAILTGILTRRRELAMLQSIGMTGKQLKTMLTYEGVYYAAGAIAVSLLLSIAAGPLLSKVLESVFWFFSYRFTVLPIAILAPVFVLLGILAPLIVYAVVSKRSIVQRLRETE